MARFCIKCGTELVDGICPKCEHKESETTDGLQHFFISPKEKRVAVLGNNYLARFLSNGAIEKGFAVVSDKRVYFQGKKYCFGEDGEIEATYNSRVVDLRDVTGTGFDSFVDNQWLIKGIVRFVLSIVFIFLATGGVVLLGFIGLFVLFHGLYNVYKYFKSKLSLIVIQYAGGEVAYDLKWFNDREIDIFQKQLRLAKDKLLEEEGNTAIQKAQMNTENGVAEEITKLADLLTKGLITQEEFEKMKRKLIG